MQDQKKWGDETQDKKNDVTWGDETQDRKNMGTRRETKKLVDETQEKKIGR